METSSANFRIFERPFQFHVFRQFDGIAQKDIWSVHDQFLRVYHVIGQQHLNKNHSNFKNQMHNKITRIEKKTSFETSKFTLVNIQFSERNHDF